MERMEYIVCAANGDELSVHDDHAEAARVVRVNEKHGWFVRERRWVVAEEYDVVDSASRRLKARLKTILAEHEGHPINEQLLDHVHRCIVEELRTMDAPYRDYLVDVASDPRHPRTLDFRVGRPSLCVDCGRETPDIGAVPVRCREDEARFGHHTGTEPSEGDPT